MRIAQLLKDDEYLKELYNHMAIADANFRDGQTYEPKALVVRCLIECLTKPDPKTHDEYLDLNKVVKGMDIVQRLKFGYTKGLSPGEVKAYLMELGFDVGESGGRNRVKNLTLPQLVAACDETGINDELVAKAVTKSKGGTP